MIVYASVVINASYYVHKVMTRKAKRNRDKIINKQSAVKRGFNGIRWNI